MLSNTVVNVTTEGLNYSGNDSYATVKYTVSDVDHLDTLLVLNTPLESERKVGIVNSSFAKPNDEKPSVQFQYRILATESPFTFAKSGISPDEDGGVTSLAIPNQDFLPSGLFLNNTTGSLYGACEHLHDLSIVGVIRITSNSTEAMEVAASANLTWARSGKLYVSQDPALPYDAWVTEVSFSKPSWIGLQCALERPLSHEPWYSVPFHDFPRILGANTLPRTTEPSIEYWIGLIGAGAPFILIAIIVAVIWPSAALWESCRNFASQKQCWTTRRGTLAHVEQPNVADARTSSQSQTTDIKEAEKQMYLKQIEEIDAALAKEKDELGIILAHAPWHVRRSLFVVIVFLLCVTGAAFFGAIAMAVSVNDVIQMADQLRETVRQLRSTVQLALQALSDLGPLSDCGGGPATALAQQQLALEQLLSFADEKNYVLPYWLLWAVPQFQVAFAVTTVSVGLSVAAPCVMLWSSLLTCCTFHWNSNVTCSRTSRTLAKLASPVSVVLLVVLWCTLALAAVFAFAVSDFCTPLLAVHVPPHTGAVNPLSDLPAPFAPAGFHLGAFFSDCRYELGDPRSSPVGLNFTRFNPQVMLAAHAAALGAEYLEPAAASCPALAGPLGLAAGAVEAALAEAAALGGCASQGRTVSTMLQRTCDGGQGAAGAEGADSVLGGSFLVVVALVVACVTHTALIPYLGYLCPDLARLHNANLFHTDMLAKAERKLELKRLLGDVERQLGQESGAGEGSGEAGRSRHGGDGSQDAENEGTTESEHQTEAVGIA